MAQSISDHSPPKLQIKPVQNEPEDQQKLSEKMALEKNKMELSRLSANSNEEKLKSFDQQMEIENSK